MSIEHNGKKYRVKHKLTIPERQTIEYFQTRFEKGKIDEFEFLDTMLRTISAVLEINKEELAAMDSNSAISLGSKVVSYGAPQLNDKYKK